ncbi:MAG TPA: hypothetical protein VFE05_08790 [Longimicrobiaceae bacterium]|jgi:hypothetical protein|nr:hypothetical protein [Longimicrobiaceae bacterium]
MQRTRWLIYTVVIGLIPLGIRALIYICARRATLDFALNEGDLVAFGLVLSVTNINELEHARNVDPRWKTRCVGLSVVFIIIFGALLMAADTVALDDNLFDIRNLKIVLSVLCMAILAISHAINAQLALLEDRLTQPELRPEVTT